MSGWVKIPEEWIEQEAIERLPAEAIVVHLSALAYVARHSTDGRLPTTATRKLWPVEDLAAMVALLVTEGHWQPFSGGWFIRDWSTFVLSATEVERRREDGRQRTERWRRHKLGDHSMCDRCQAVKGTRDASRNASGDMSGDGPPIRSAPTRRGGEERGPAPDSAGAPPALSRVPPPHPFDPGAECCPLPPENPCHLGQTA